MYVDSIFNRSGHSYVFGAPDFFKPVVRSAYPGRIDVWAYNSDEENYTTDGIRSEDDIDYETLIHFPDVAQLDVWSLEQLRTLLHSARHNSTLATELQRDKVIFFLYFLATDMAGHAHRPHSKVISDASAEIYSG